MGSVVTICLVGALALTSLPAAAQTAESLDAVAVGGIIDPASIIDVEGFSERAAAWATAQADHRTAAIERADALAAETKATEDAELARVEAEEVARRTAEQEARRQAEQEARRAAEAASTSTTTTTTTVPAAGEDGSADTETAGEDGSADAETAGEDGSAGDQTEVVIPPDGPSAEQWHALRQCESTNNYRAISPTGRYRGAYQFSITTWDWLAGARYPELGGVDPIDATVTDQDKMAYALYGIYGRSPWPVCGKHLP